MRVRVVDWNVNGFARKTQADLLSSLDWDVACLQEVTRRTWDSFRKVADNGDVVFDHLPSLATGEPRYGCAVLTRGPVRLESFSVLADVPSPERAAVAAVQAGEHPWWVGSWAAPPGVSWGAAGKGRQVDRFAAWLQGRPGPVVIGIDRNAPRWERHDLADDEWWNKHEPVLYGPDRSHDLRDVFRDHLAQHPDLAAGLRAAYPDGPLAVTHVRRGIPCRYDAIYASPEFAVVEVNHLWGEARAAGSDHALVTATLDLLT